MSLTRRKLFALLASLPLVGRLAPLGTEVDRNVFAPSHFEPVTHLVGDGWGLATPQYPTIAEAVEHVVAGRGDRIVIAEGHIEQLADRVSAGNPEGFGPLEIDVDLLHDLCRS